jgi:hypothetical protein
MTDSPKRIRLELDERRARGVHAAIREAINRDLLAGEHLVGAREVLELLDSRVPGWLQAGPIGGEAGYLVAAEAVLRALVHAEDERGRPSLTETELLRELGDAKPLGATAADVLERMRREKFITIQTEHRDQPWITAAPAGRRFLHRDTAAHDESAIVRDPDALLDLIYAEHGAGGRAHRPSVQAIARLEIDELVALVDVLLERGLVDPPDVPGDIQTWMWLTLSAKGSNLARERWQHSAPPGTRRYAFDHPPAPPLPYQRRLPLRISREDREHPAWYDGDRSTWCSPANWLQRSSKTKLFATLKRDGSVVWSCSRCGHTWLVYLQAFTADGQPAYADPTAGAYNRPLWRPTHRRA